jgi:CRP-like cAMP-binding protein
LLSAEPGVRLVRYRERLDTLIILGSGTVEISLPCAGGKGIVLGTAGPGKVFGLRSLLSSEPPEIEVICLTDCLFAVIPRLELFRIVKTHPEFYLAAARILSDDLQLAHGYLKSSSRRKVHLTEKRFASVR